jgi:hypothetical protein
MSYSTPIWPARFSKADPPLEDDLISYIWWCIQDFEQPHRRGHRPKILISPRTFHALCQDPMAKDIIDFINICIFNVPYEVREIPRGPDIKVVNRNGMEAVHADSFMKHYIHQFVVP